MNVFLSVPISLTCEVPNGDKKGNEVSPLLLSTSLGLVPVLASAILGEEVLDGFLSVPVSPDCEVLSETENPPVLV